MVEVTTLVLVAVVIGLVEAVKRLGAPTRVLPLVAVAIGLGLSFLAFDKANLSGIVVTGLVIGLSAVGLYSGAKNTAQ